jgi:hypothetical protein
VKAPIRIATVLLACAVPVAASAVVTDPSHIDVYVTPYYNSAGPVIKVGKFSAGLGSNSESEFIATIHTMKK